jgi:hypothetical protein
MQWVTVPREYTNWFVSPLLFQHTFSCWPLKRTSAAPRLLCNPLPSFLDRTAKALAIQLSLSDYWPSSQQWASGIFKSAVWEPAMSVDLLWLWLPKCVPRYVMCVRLREFLYCLKSRRANDCRHSLVLVSFSVSFGKELHGLHGFNYSAECRSGLIDRMGLNCWNFPWLQAS